MTIKKIKSTVTDSEGRSHEYERLEVPSPVEAFITGVEVKGYCESCPNHTKSFSCPPHSPEFADYIAGAKSATAYCIRLSLENFTGDANSRYREGARVANRLLDKILLKKKNEGLVVAGAGKCRGCTPCSCVEGEAECTNPDMRIYSLESLGVKVGELLESQFNIKLTWGDEEETAGTVSAIGAAF